MAVVVSLSCIVWVAVISGGCDWNGYYLCRHCIGIAFDAIDISLYPIDRGLAHFEISHEFTISISFNGFNRVWNPSLCPALSPSLTQCCVSSLTTTVLKVYTVCLVCELSSASRWITDTNNTPNKAEENASDLSNRQHRVNLKVLILVYFQKV